MKKSRKRPDLWEEHSQNSVMQDYKGSPAFRTKNDEGALHLFFSPYRVPTGLTDEEVLMCIALSPLKRDWESRAIKQLKKKLIPQIAEDSGNPYPKEMQAELLAISRVPAKLPEEFVTEKMTRARFRTGLKKLIRLMLIS